MQEIYTKKLYFCGIGGVAMAASAILFKNAGFQVSGSDNIIYSPMREYLSKNNISYHKLSDPKVIDPLNDWIFVIGNVLSRGNPQLERILELNYNYISLPELLKYYILRKRKNIVIAGTHGKTTTTAITTNILIKSGYNPGYLIGGMLEDNNLSAKIGIENGWFVIEGDEYDSCFYDKRAKFFHYLPNIFLINNLEYDHSDIYESLNEIKETFKLALRQIPKNGLIVVNGDDLNALEVANCGFSPIISFGFKITNDVIIKIDNKFSTNKVYFSINYKGDIQHFETNLIGSFNVFNITASIIIAKHLGIDWDEIKASIKSFKPVNRRLNKLTKNNKITIFDDFAHHPTAIKNTINAVKKTFKDKKLFIVYEPRSFTSLSKIHQSKLPTAFSNANNVYIISPKRWSDLPKNTRLDINQLILDIRYKSIVANHYTNYNQLYYNLKTDVKGGSILLFISQSSLQNIPKKLATYWDKIYGIDEN